jgi:hypothetical protein
MASGRSLSKILRSLPVTFRLAGLGLVSLLIYILAFWLPANLLTLYDRPRLDLSLLFQGGNSAYARLIIAFVILGFLYWGSFRLVSRQVRGRAGWMIVIVGMLAYILVFLFMAPFDAADIYDNIMHGRILGVHNANPFEQVIANYPDDPFFRYTAWKRAHSAYGPLWEILAGLAARLAGDGIIANVLAFKILPGLFHLASVAIIYFYLRAHAPEKALGGVLLLGWNPVLLYESWGNGHNDMAMAFWFLLAFWWLSKRRYSLGILALLLGTLVKFIPVLLIPVVIMIALRDLPKTTQKLAFITKTGLAGGLLLGLFYYPFWNGGSTLDIGRRMQLFTTSLPSIIYKALTPSLGADEAGQIVSLSALGLLFLFVLYQSLTVGKSDPANTYLRAAFYILTFYLLAVCLWFHQWYSLWLIALAPLLDRNNRRFALLFGFWVLSQKLVFGPRLVPRILHASPGQVVWLEALLVVGVLGIPWLYAAWNFWKGLQLRRTYDAA